MTRWDDAGTPLSSLDNVPALPSLLSLEAVACGLVHLGANVGHRWPRLEALDVNRNQLTSLDDLAGSPPAGLGRLIVHDNRLRDAGRLLRALRAVGPAMLELDLRDNPITRAAGDARDSYRAAIVHAVNTPTLAVLDGMAVTTAERERALRRRSTLAPRGYDNNSGAGRADDAVPTALFGLPAGVLLGSAPAPPRRTCGRAGKAPRECRRPLQSPAFRGPWAVDHRAHPPGAPNSGRGCNRGAALAARRVRPGHVLGDPVARQLAAGVRRPDRAGSGRNGGGRCGCGHPGRQRCRRPGQWRGGRTSVVGSRQRGAPIASATARRDALQRSSRRRPRRGGQRNTHRRLARGAAPLPLPSAAPSTLAC